MEKGWFPKGKSTSQFPEEGAVGAGQAKPTDTLYNIHGPVFDLVIFTNIRIAGPPPTPYRVVRQRIQLAFCLRAKS